MVREGFCEEGVDEGWSHVVLWRKSLPDIGTACAKAREQKMLPLLQDPQRVKCDCGREDQEGSGRR